MPKIKANEIEIEYDIAGEGEPLVLIAGLGYTRWSWHRVIPDLARHFQVISFDNRGVGGTTRTPGPYSAELLAEDTASLLDALGIKKATIVGISMGGFITQALYGMRPDLFRKMVLMSTGFGGPKHISPSEDVISALKNTAMDIRKRALLSCAPDFAEREPEFVDYWIEERTKNPINVDGYNSQLAIGLKLLVGNGSYETALSNVSVPTLILFGELDPLTPAGNAELLRAAIPNSKCVVLPGEGHFLPFECPKDVIREIYNFVMENPTAATNI